MPFEKGSYSYHLNLFHWPANPNTYMNGLMEMVTWLLWCEEAFQGNRMKRTA